MIPARPVRLQLSRSKGFNLQKLSRETNGLEAVNVARPSRFGNAITIAFCQAWFDLPPAKARLKAVEMFRRWINGKLPKGWVTRTPPPLLDVTTELCGKNLACWCKPGEPCHADVLLEIANR